MAELIMSMDQERRILDSIDTILHNFKGLEKNIKSEDSPSKNTNLRKLSLISDHANRIAHCIPRHSIADVGWDSADFHLRLGHVLNDPDHRVIILDYNDAEDTVGCYDLKYKGIAYFTADEVSPHNKYCTV